MTLLHVRLLIAGSVTSGPPIFAVRPAFSNNHSSSDGIAS